MASSISSNSQCLSRLSLMTVSSMVDISTIVEISLNISFNFSALTHLPNMYAQVAYDSEATTISHFPW